MHTTSHICVHGNPDTVYGRVFELAARIEDWPSLLSHYRYMRIVKEGPGYKIADFGASRSGFPVRWRGRQEPERESGIIRYTHLRGVTRGMEVEWRIEKRADHVHICLDHWLSYPPTPRGSREPAAWLPGELFARYIVGALFIDNIAGKTLSAIKLIVEAEQEKPT